jgi:hypothetical protein
MSEERTSSRGGIGFIGLLTIVFITLKLCGVIDWSWWWVWSPVWISLSFTVGILLLIAAFGLFCLFMAWVTGQLQ